ncbi:MAG: DUF3465 domain-containing protein [Candidatus Binatia bacterium]
MKKLLLIAILLGAGYVGFIQDSPLRLGRGTASESDQVLASAFESRRSGFQVEGRGVVVRLLAADVDGARHQRFILRLNSGQTLLVAHNIDRAPRIAGLREGDEVLFNGEYEWNSEGGVLHWTHRDPAGRHSAGWLKHDGRTYQ